MYAPRPVHSKAQDISTPYSFDDGNAGMAKAFWFYLINSCGYRYLQKGIRL
jgi:hypothetical protein